MLRRLLTAVFACGLSVATATAQFEASVGGGFGVQYLPIDAPAGATVGYEAEAFASPGYELTLGYRFSERWGARLLAATSTRATNQPLSVSPFGSGADTVRAFQNYIDLGPEVRYYLHPAFSIGGGLGYGLTGSRFTDLDLPNQRRLGDTLDAGFPNFAYASLGAEVHFKGMDVRLGTQLGLTQGHDPDVVYLDDQLRDLGPLRGRWRGASLTARWRVPFGKTRYAAGLSVDSSLARAADRLLPASPNLSIGLIADAGVELLASGGDDDIYVVQPVRLRLGIAADRRLGDDWTFTSALAYDRFRASTARDTLREDVRAGTSHRWAGLDATVGLRRRLFGDFSVAAETGPLLAFGQRATRTTGANDPAAPLADGLPLARAVWMGGARLEYQAGPRLRLGGQVSYTLTRPFSDAPDTRPVTPGRRPERWLFGGANATWMLLRG